MRAKGDSTLVTLFGKIVVSTLHLVIIAKSVYIFLIKTTSGVLTTVVPKTLNLRQNIIF